MIGHYRAAWAIPLLLLAACPVTVPFSASDIEVLFWNGDDHPSAILQSKSTPDKTPAGLTGGFLLDARHPPVLESSVSATTPLPDCGGRQFPLRI